MDIVIVGLAALFASLLTFFSGFGLGTILMPVFVIFFPVEIAIALTGVVHLLNNLFKMTLVGKYASWKIVVKFGAPAIAGAFIGAWLLMYFSGTSEWMVYYIGEKRCVITPIKVVIAVLMAGFALLEILPAYKNLQFAENKLLFGGAISGFFGGLSGHQGALRSAFLIRCGLKKDSFIATGIIIACVVDVSRISVYFARLSKIGIGENISVLLTAVGAAFIGALAGRYLLKKITFEVVHVTVTVMILLLAIVLGLGIV